MPSVALFLGPYKSSPMIGDFKEKALCNLNWCVLPVFGENKTQVNNPVASPKTLYSVIARCATIVSGIFEKSSKT